MSVADNKSFVRRYAEEWNTTLGDADKIRALGESYIGAGYIHHSLIRGDMSRAQRMNYVLMLAPSMPDLIYSEEDMIAEGDKVVVRYTAHFTHKGPFMGIPPSGRQIAVKGVEIYRIEG